MVTVASGTRAGIARRQATPRRLRDPRLETVATGLRSSLEQAAPGSVGQRRAARAWLALTILHALEGDREVAAARTRELIERTHDAGPTLRRVRRWAREVREFLRHRQESRGAGTGPPGELGAAPIPIPPRALGGPRRGPAIPGLLELLRRRRELEHAPPPPPLDAAAFQLQVQRLAALGPLIREVLEMQREAGRVLLPEPGEARLEAFERRALDGLEDLVEGRELLRRIRGASRGGRDPEMEEFLERQGAHLDNLDRTLDRLLRSFLERVLLLRIEWALGAPPEGAGAPAGSRSRAAEPASPGTVPGAELPIPRGPSVPARPLLRVDRSPGEEPGIFRPRLLAAMETGVRSLLRVAAGDGAERRRRVEGARALALLHWMGGQPGEARELLDFVSGAAPPGPGESARTSCLDVLPGLGSEEPAPCRDQPLARLVDMAGRLESEDLPPWLHPSEEEPGRALDLRGFARRSRELGRVQQSMQRVRDLMAEADEVAAGESPRVRRDYETRALARLGEVLERRDFLGRFLLELELSSEPSVAAYREERRDGLLELARSMQRTARQFLGRVLLIRIQQALRAR